MAQVLACCQQQTLENIEFIIIDDGSADNTFAYLQEQTKADARFKIFRLEQNSGPYACRNLGLKKATGKYIGFFDCDDKIPNDYFEKMYQKAIKSGADIVYTNYNNRTHKLKQLKNLKDRFDVLPNGALWDKIYKTSFLTKHHLTFKEEWYTADNIFIISAFYYAKKIELIDSPRYQWIKREDSIGLDTSKKDKRQQDILHVLETVITFANDKKLLEAEMTALKCFCERSLCSYKNEEAFTSRFYQILDINNQHNNRKRELMQSVLKLKRKAHILSEQKYQEKSNIALIESSPLFDKKWYLAKNPDVKKSKIGAAKHYYKIGFKEGRNPSPLFNNNDYLRRYPDVATLGVNPLLHYMQEGEQKGYTYNALKGRAAQVNSESFWEKVRYVLEYPIRVQEEYERLKAEIKALENIK